MNKKRPTLHQLYWSPVNKAISSHIRGGSEFQLLIVPFIKIEALSYLLSFCEDTGSLKIITRWSGRDLLNNVSDTEIYPFLKERRIPLYINGNIHLKLYVFNDNYAFHSSGNVTKRGMGLSPINNEEIGCFVELGHKDWRNIYNILNNSLRVDGNIYSTAINYVNKNKAKKISIPKLNFVSVDDKQFSILSLPSSPSPSDLYDYYISSDNFNKEIQSNYIHDLILFDIDEGLNRQEFFSKLKTNFTCQPFIKFFVNFIKKETSARFGLVNQWLQQHCSDKPTPYKWELKNNTKYLYNWLAFFYKEISWDRPNYSMIIRWME